MFVPLSPPTGNPRPPHDRPDPRETPGRVALPAPPAHPYPTSSCPDPAGTPLPASPAPGVLPVLPVPFTHLFSPHITLLTGVLGHQASMALPDLPSVSPSTVCLHAEDIHKPEIVGSWRDAGHRVVTAGSRHDPDFLSRFLALVLAAERVVANRLMTPVLYAASLGRDVAVYGDPLSLSTAEIHGQDAIRSLWPELHGAALDAAVTTDLARTELGFQHLLEPVALRSALGWSSRSAGPAVQYWAGAPIRKAMNVMGLGRRDPGSSEKQVGASPLAWLRHPMSHLPRPLPAHAATLDPLPAPIEL